MGCRFSESAPLPVDLFRGCTALKAVKLNMLSVDHPSWYCGDEAVNPVQEVLRGGFCGWPMHEEIFRGCPALEMVEIRSCMFRAFPEYLFSSCRKLRTLDVTCMEKSKPAKQLDRETLGEESRLDAMDEEEERLKLLSHRELQAEAKAAGLWGAAVASRESLISDLMDAFETEWNSTQDAALEAQGGDREES
jgi:hypothetical protein